MIGARGVYVPRFLRSNPTALGTCVPRVSPSSRFGNAIVRLSSRLVSLVPSKRRVPALGPKYEERRGEASRSETANRREKGNGARRTTALNCRSCCCERERERERERALHARRQIPAPGFESIQASDTSLPVGHHFSLRSIGETCR